MDFSKAKGLEEGQGFLESCLPCLCWPESPESLHPHRFVLLLDHWVFGKWACFFFFFFWLTLGCQFSGTQRCWVVGQGQEFQTSSVCPDCMGPYEAKELGSVKLEKDVDSEETAGVGSGVAAAGCS